MIQVSPSEDQHRPSTYIEPTDQRVLQSIKLSCSGKRTWLFYVFFFFKLPPATPRLASGYSFLFIFWLVCFLFSFFWNNFFPFFFSPSFFFFTISLYIFVYLFPFLFLFSDQAFFFLFFVFFLLQVYLNKQTKAHLVKGPKTPHCKQRENLQRTSLWERTAETQHYSAHSTQHTAQEHFLSP